MTVPSPICQADYDLEQGKYQCQCGAKFLVEDLLIWNPRHKNLKQIQTTKWGIRQCMNTCKLSEAGIMKKERGCASQTDLLLQSSVVGRFVRLRLLWITMIIFFI